MDDRWFIFSEMDWLYFHRSWTGRCIFQIRFKTQKGIYKIVEAWSSRNVKVGTAMLPWIIYRKRQ
jgi:hypothetical protein